MSVVDEFTSIKGDWRYWVRWLRRAAAVLPGVF
jgi:hypothetical protein